MREKKARRKAAGRLIDVWVFGLTVVPSARTHLVSGAAEKGVEEVVVKLAEGQVGGAVVASSHTPRTCFTDTGPCAFAVDVRFLLAAAWCPTPPPLPLLAGAVVADGTAAEFRRRSVGLAA